MKAAKKTAPQKMNGKSPAKMLAKSFQAPGPVTGNGHATAPEEKAALEKWARKEEKKTKKAQKKAQKKAAKNGNGSAKAPSGPFPMVALIDEQVRTSIPEELVARVKGAKSKKNIISSTYPYSETDEGVGLPGRDRTAAN